MDLCYGDLRLESGDLITLTSSLGPPMSLFLPVLTAEADPSTDLVTGQAPPLIQVVVEVDHSLHLTVTADAQGQYCADFSSLGGFNGYAQGEAVWTSPEGYAVARVFKASPSSEYGCPTHLNSALIGTNYVYLQSGSDCDPFTLRLLSASGQVKFEHNFLFNPGGYSLLDENQRPVLILPGDQIEIVIGGEVQSSRVPTLTLSLDAHTDQAYGQAPPLAEVELIEYYSSTSITTTADAQGSFAFDLSGEVDLKAGMYMQVVLPDFPQFYRIGVIPVLDAQLYSCEIEGRLQPLTPFTITVTTPLTVSTPITGYAKPWGDYSLRIYPAPGPHFQGYPGESIEVETPSQIWQMTLPDLTAHLDAAHGLLSGQAPPNSPLWLNLYVDYQESYFAILTATANGAYSYTFPVPGSHAYIFGHLTHYTGEDMRTSLDFSTPTWEVTLGSEWVIGSSPVTGAPVTVTLQSGDGAFTQVVTQTLVGSNYSVVFTRRIHPGDRLRLDTVDGQVSEFTVPYLSAVHDFARRVLEGRAPPGGQLYTYIGYSSRARQIRLLPGGRYGVDTSDLYLLVGMSGEVYYEDAYGNMVICLFTIRGYTNNLPLIRRLAAP